jgi:hypothetical protein
VSKKIKSMNSIPLRIHIYNNKNRGRYQIRLKSLVGLGDQTVKTAVKYEGRDIPIKRCQLEEKLKAKERLKH